MENTNQERKSETELRSITDHAKPSFIENYKERMGQDWVFDKFHEKAILVVCTAWSVFSLLKFLWSLL